MIRPLCQVDKSEARARWAAADWEWLTPRVIASINRHLPRFGSDSLDELDDIASMALLRCVAWEGVPDNPAAFVLRTARNLLISSQRSGWARYMVHSVGKEDLIGEAVDPATEADALEEAEDHAHQVARVKAAMAQLPATQRRVLYLHGMKGQGHRRIAETLGMTEGATKMTFVRARENVRRFLSGQPMQGGSVRMGIDAVVGLLPTAQEAERAQQKQVTRARRAAALEIARATRSANAAARRMVRADFTL